MGKARGWTCRRKSCKQKNPPRTRKCQTCGVARPKRKVVEHKRVLQELSYEDFVAINGGEFCGICGKLPASKRLDRDHDHKTGQARGVLCHRCNRALPAWKTIEWLYAAIAYLERALKRET